MPPQTPKFPPVTGARAFIDDREPTRRSPYVSPILRVSKREELCGKESGWWTHSWRVSGTLYAVPYTASYCTHGERSAKVVQDDPGARERAQSGKTVTSLPKCLPGVPCMVRMRH